MSANTRIEFAHTTVNYMGGCTRISTGCRNCYAVRMAHRHGGNPKLPQYHGLTTYDTDRGPEWTGELRWFDGVMEAALLKLATAKPQRIFHCSMTDLCHERAPLAWLARAYAFCAALPQHKHIIITKRSHLLAERTLALRGEPGKGWQPDAWDTARRPLHDACRKAYGMGGRAKSLAHALLRKAEQIGVMNAYAPWPLPNVMLMATCEDQQRAEERIPHLLKLAEQGWHMGVIIEPMLGPVDLGLTRGPRDEDYHGYNGDGPIDYVITSRADDLHWVICGGETGANARPMHPDWPRSLRNQCQAAGVPFFFKQRGEWAPKPEGSDGSYKAARSRGATALYVWPEDRAYVERIGTRRAGRELDGRTWDEVPA